MNIKNLNSELISLQNFYDLKKEITTKLLKESFSLKEEISNMLLKSLPDMQDTDKNIDILA